MLAVTAAFHNSQSSFVEAIETAIGLQSFEFLWEYHAAPILTHPTEECGCTCSWVGVRFSFVKTGKTSS